MDKKIRYYTLHLISYDLKEQDAEHLFDSPQLIVAAESNIATICFLNKRI